MAKQPPVERFKLSCEVETINLGPTLAALTKMGLTNLGFELITDVRAFAKNTHPEIRGAIFLAEWIKEHPTFKSKEAVNAFKADGRGDGHSAYGAITNLVDNGILKKIGEGMYSRADVKHLAAPKKKLKAKPSQSVNKYTISNGDFIVRIARRNHGRINTTSLRKVFEADGRMSSSISPTINALLNAKKLKRAGVVGGGEYLLVTKAQKPKPKAKPVTNGHAVPSAPVEAVTNG